MISNELLKRRIWGNLEKVRTTLNWSHEQLRERLMMTERAYTRDREQNRPVCASSMLNLASFLDLNLTDLSYGKIDFKTLQEHFNGNAFYLPEKYSVGAFSRRRTSLLLLDYCDQNMGFEFTTEALRKLQVQRIVFSDPEAYISCRFPTDFCDYIVEAGVEASLLAKMGARSAVINKPTELGRRLALCESVKDAYDVQVNQLMGHFEKNHIYKTIQLTRKDCIIEAHESEETLDALGTHHIGSPYTCIYRTGVAAAVSAFLDLPLANAIETHCVHRGDPCCRFSIDYEYPHYVHTKRRGAPSPSQLAGLISQATF